jgi:hypothetical protein
MSTENATKINQLLNTQPHGVVLQSAWLVTNGYSLELQKRYRKSKWLKSIGTGAMIRTGNRVTYEGAVYALQQQSSLTIHPGGKTALSLQGRSHYLDLSAKRVAMFGGKAEKPPAWFRKHDWGLAIDYHRSSFLPADLGLTDLDVAQQSFSIKVSSAARALMECLYLAPEKQELTECYQLMENLNNLRPDLVQSLLEKCESVKVKRLFLYMATKAKHDWLQYVDTTKVDLGRANAASPGMAFMSPNTG